LEWYAHDRLKNNPAWAREGSGTIETSGGQAVVGESTERWESGKFMPGARLPDRSEFLGESWSSRDMFDF
jgi:hypothetical protein